MHGANPKKQSHATGTVGLIIIQNIKHTVTVTDRTQHSRRGQSTDTLQTKYTNVKGKVFFLFLFITLIGWKGGGGATNVRTTRARTHENRHTKTVTTVKSIFRRVFGQIPQLFFLKLQ